MGLMIGYCLIIWSSNDSAGLTVFIHEVGARHFISPPDLSKMLFNQIGAHSTVLVVPDRPHIIGLLVVMGFFNLLLEPKLFNDIKID